MPDILITGAAGFIGSSLSEELLKEGRSVTGLDCINDYYDPIWKRENLSDLNRYEKFEFIEGDILNEKLVQNIFSNHKFDAVVHLAARAGVRPSIIDPKLYESVNVRGTLNLLDATHTHMVDKFVFASSSSVYGNQTHTPFSEDDRVDYPVSPYAATKKAGEELCFTYSHLYDLSVTCLRFFTVYGPKGRPDMAPYLFTDAIVHGKPIKRFGRGDSGRDYTYIDDIVSGIIAAIDYEESFDIFNLGNSSPVQLNDFIATIENITGKKAVIEELPKQQGDVDLTYADISKAKRLLGYKPQTKLEVGLSKFIEWYTLHRFKEIPGK
jgi:UDP-glucuronate 4-epimerase